MRAIRKSYRIPPLPFLVGVCTFLAAVGGAIRDGAAAEVNLLDGRVVQGELRHWRDGTLEFRSDDATSRFAEGEILRVRLAAAAAADPLPYVELIDGSVIPFTAFTVTGTSATIQPTFSTEPITVGTKLLSAVHLQPPTPAIAAQWGELRQTDEAGDLIVIRKEGAVDHLAGRLGDVTEEHVAFHLDGDEFPVERTKVDGLVYYHAEEPRFADPLCVIRGRGGLKLSVATASLAGESLEVQTVGGIDLVVRLQDVEAADFSAGKVTFLAEITPRSVQSTPLVAVPAGARLAAQATGPVTDRGFFSAEAQLRYPRYDGERIVGWQLRPHSQVVGLRSRSEVTYQLPPDFRRFRATAGIDGMLGGRGNVHLVLFGDDERLWERAIDGSEPPVAIEMDITDVRRLRIVVDYGEEGDAADRLYLGDARITK